MNILAIDPGSEYSAIVVWNGKEIKYSAIHENTYFLNNLHSIEADILVIEKIECYGMPVGKEVFETVFWCGRFCERWGKTFYQLPRREVKLYLCNSPRAKDSNIRQVLIDRFGSPGTKKNPGITYGLKKDLWQAFALAVTFWDLKLKRETRGVYHTVVNGIGWTQDKTAEDLNISQQEEENDIERIHCKNSK